VLAAANYLDKSSSSSRRRIVVVISDGDDTARILGVSAAQNRSDSMKLIGVDAQLQLIRKAQLDTQREVQRAEITFYSINPSGQTMHLNVRTARSEEGMERIAAATGGAAFVSGNEGGPARSRGDALHSFLRSRSAHTQMHRSPSWIG